MKKEQLASEIKLATAEGYAVISTMMPEDSASDLPLGAGKFTPLGDDCYSLKKIQVSETSESVHKGKKIQFVVTNGKVVIGGNTYNKNIAGEISSTVDCYVVTAGKYKRLTTRQPDDVTAPVPQQTETV